MAAIDKITPDFFIFGVPKAGSTSLYNVLKEHPKICMSHPKEPHFFDYNYSLKGYNANTFPDSHGRMLGDGTPQYLALPFVHQRVFKDCPNAKLIVMLREPVSRAFSEWWMLRSRGQEPLGFADAVADNMVQLQRGRTFEGDRGSELWRDAYRSIVNGKVTIRTYLDHGYYASHLQNLLSFFDRTNIHIEFLDQFCNDPSTVIFRICNFLEIDHEFIPIHTTDTRSNQALGRGVSGVWNLMRRLGLLSVSPYVPEAWRTAVKSMTRRAAPPPVIPDDQKLLLQNHYAKENDKLRKLLGVQLPLWP